MIGLLISLLILLVILYVVKLIVDALELPPNIRTVVMLTIGLLFLLILLGQLGLVPRGFW